MSKEFPPEFKRDVVAVARRGAFPIAEVEADFDISESTQHRWALLADVDDGIPGSVTCGVLGLSAQGSYEWKQNPVCGRDWDDAAW